MSPTPSALRSSSLPLPLLHRGKVREMYEAGPDLLLMVASDRVSAFDVIMEQAVPRKGEVLNLITAWWLQRLEAEGVAHHAVSADPAEILRLVPALGTVDDVGQWARRSLLVRRTSPLPVECVVRGYLAGSAWSEYRDSGTLAGEPLPSGLVRSQRLPAPLFSPATKAVEGHDENITFHDVTKLLGGERAGKLRRLSLDIYAVGAGVASKRGLILADTKFEFGVDAGGHLLLIDEVLTPDSSRYWPEAGYRVGVSPPSLDKQPVRDFLESVEGWDRRPPPPRLPDEVVKATTDRYLEIFRRLTGSELDDFAPPSFPSERGEES
ncbi:MAG: phosphoribosylaminoimidazolesuccinocarboxamide synthase [Gemmatimonadales bacterium]|nr:MAG: phosphoribosylaminoimidazolesuccinocarboxamide synthase [Gemmatimonadales bacterium]